ncbi:NYN domain-containing protein [Janibacter sp. DB-40]|uniref:NYN domain-containing protein n=1 Tax=Janibacter sp. DB-40 TaxID=3028808 RepID=UPI002404A465|nr:NYN domain-containing protein [Janibacter sp. DB-40]
MDADASTSTRIAVLIDCDNVSSRHTSAVLEELAKYGTPTVKRAYGDWTTTQLGGWKEMLLRHAVQPVQQFPNSTGKNASDSTLIIDAMDLLWQGNVDAFALVSSDSDFTRLATRLRESGKRVFGVGEGKTPDPLRRAVDQFIQIELLVESDQPTRTAADEPQATRNGAADSTRDEASGDNSNSKTQADLQSKLTKAVNASLGDNGWTNLSALGQHLQRTNPDFDSRAFGHQKLVTLVEDQNYLETKRSGTTVLVRTKQGGKRKSPAKKTTTKASAKSTTSGKSPAQTGATKGTTARKSAPGASTKA